MENPMKLRMVQVLRPGLNPKKRNFEENDYITVPRLSLRGTYIIAELMSIESLTTLQRFTNRIAFLSQVDQTWNDVALNVDDRTREY
jgi:hypothetical protein